MATDKGKPLRNFILGTLSGIVISVVAAVVTFTLPAILGKNPNTEVQVEYFPFIAPQELSKIYDNRLDYSYSLLKKLKNSKPPVDITEDNLKTILKLLNIDELEKLSKANSIFRLEISNRGTLPETEFKIWVKNAISYYYRKPDRGYLAVGLTRIDQDKEGYITLPQVTPNEKYEIVAFF
jgi:hypothetical protein